MRHSNSNFSGQGIGEFRVRFGAQNRFSANELCDAHEKPVFWKNGERGQEYGQTINLLKILCFEKRSPASWMRGSIIQATGSKSVALVAGSPARTPFDFTRQLNDRHHQPDKQSVICCSTRPPPAKSTRLIEKETFAMFHISAASGRERPV
jgi:hypothetical protein